ncbi:TadE/TadG family type IV pilus assembly protein [Thalassobius sp. S69A]|uniref:TadE/TadG family type IV pilus assembly protein n=1 Tax=unclassified Thalassovita TaxID=2619711 RepID=UPI000C677F59|nr:pilus assembly protein TadE [Paracoccaceae bacterium]
MKRLNKLKRWLLRDERGSAAVEFVIVFPFFMGFLLSSFELTLITMRSTMLEHSLDRVVREIRLDTGAVPQHDDIKDRICDHAPIIPDCSKNLRLELIRVDPRNWVDPEPLFDCTDQSDTEVRPVRSFVSSLEDNDLMMLRACAKFDPIFPNAALGFSLSKDGAGMAALVATSAFVQEPS